MTDRIWAQWENGLLVSEWHEVGILSLFGPLLEPAARTGSAVPQR